MALSVIGQKAAELVSEEIDQTKIANDTRLFLKMQLLAPRKEIFSCATFSAFFRVIYSFPLPPVLILLKKADRMNKGGLVCVLMCVLVCVASADPTRPTISDQFYSEVHVAINDNDRPLIGGGTPTSFSYSSPLSPLLCFICFPLSFPFHTLSWLAFDILNSITNRNFGIRCPQVHE
jgi:hypothetical protein